MVFSSLPFLFLFLPIFFVIYFASSNITVRNVVLVASSLLFYAWGQPILVIFLVGSGLVDYGNGLLIERFRGSPLKILGLISTLVFNLGLLITFKYSGFIVDNVNAILTYTLHMQRPNFMLPVGMSFYTFETISYHDRRLQGQTQAPSSSLLNFMVFIASFPAPGGRADHPLPSGRRGDHQSHQYRPADWSAGVTRFCRGLLKKVFFANVVMAPDHPVLPTRR